MKYCPKCKLRMPAEAVVCRQCGGALRTVGEPAAGEGGSAAPGTDAELTMQLAGLQHAVRRSQATLVALGCVASLLFVALLLLLVGLRFNRVMQFAEVEQMDVQLSKDANGEAEVKFARRTFGKVEFVREAAGRTETLIDYGREGASSGEGDQSFVWSGSDAADFTIRARWRDGWGLTERVWVAREGRINQGD